MAGALAPADARRADVFQPIQTRIIRDPGSIEAVFTRLVLEDIDLRLSGASVDAERGRLCSFSDSFLALAAADPVSRPEDEIQVRFELDGHPHFFSSRRLGAANDLLELSRPEVIHQEERRDRIRLRDGSSMGPVTIAVGGESVRGELVDRSSDGLGLRVDSTATLGPGDVVLVTSGEAKWDPMAAEVCSVAPIPDASGWRRIGLRVREGGEQAPAELISVVAAPLVDIGEEAVSIDRGPTVTRLTRFRNARREELSAIVDSWGSGTGGPVIVIPPAWGKTKESLLNLSETIVSVFRAGDQPVTVVRFDGVHRRGAGYREPEAAERPRENVNYSFSQGVRDIRTTLDFLDEELGVDAARYILVSFSIASVEARRAIAEDRSRRVRGWISVVGASDPQALMRSLSGGIDYFGQAERGHEIGLQNVQGMRLDIDNAGRDALANGLAFLDDTRRDMASIDIPVTWLHGRDDGWNQLDRVRDMMSCGDHSRRKLVELATGHQLRTSREAGQVFQLIAIEAARMATGRTLVGCPIDRDELRRRRRVEHQWSRTQKVDIRRFWHDYLVGQNGHLGIELITAMSEFHEFMERQIQSLELRGGEVVLDLGAGTGAFPCAIESDDEGARPSRIIEVDLIPDALRRGRERASGCSPRIEFVAADVCEERGPWVPVQSHAADRVLASLLINYVPNPERVLAECFRILRPGGRLVVSGMRRDADVSRICLSGLSELRAGRGRTLLAADGEEQLGRSVRDFISSGGELLDLEAEGQFRFWDADEMARMLRAAGFEDVEVAAGYGSPSQASIASGRRP